MYKTTKKDFSEFKKECEYWINYFGLKDWEVYFYHELRKGNRGSCVTDYEAKIITLYLSTEWNDSPEKLEIKKTAFHEVCEILLTQLVGLAKIYFSYSHVHEYTHEVIRRLENTIFKEKRK